MDAVPCLEGTLVLEQPLTVHVDDDRPVLVLPAGTAIGVASTDTDAVLSVLVVGYSGRQEYAGEAARRDVEAALVEVGPPPAPAPRPITDPRPLNARLGAIVRNAERGAGYRKALGALVEDLVRAGRTTDARRLVDAAGRPGTAYAGGAAHRLSLITLEES